MANPYKGEVEFEADGKQYKLSFSADAMCELEGAMGKDMDEIISMFQSQKREDETTLAPKIKLSDLRVMFWKGLGDHQPDTTFDDTRAILKKVGPVEMATLIGKAFMLSMPEGDPETDENPPKPVGQKDGTGPALLNNGVSLA